MKLIFGIKKTWSWNYSTVDYWRPRSEKSVMDKMEEQVGTAHKGDAGNVTGVVSTIVGGHIPYRWFGKWLPVMDCDGMSDMVAARSYLASIDIKSACISSSPSKFWVVPNVVMSAKQCIKLMRKTPGVDERYVKICDDSRGMAIRAFPRPNFAPQFEENPDIDGLALEWYEAFRRYFDTDRMQKLQHAINLKDALWNGTLMTKAADPSFKV